MIESNVLVCSIRKRDNLFIKTFV